MASIMRTELPRMTHMPMVWEELSKITICLDMKSIKNAQTLSVLDSIIDNEVHEWIETAEYAFNFSA